MFKQTDTKRVLFVHTLKRSLLGLFVFLSVNGMFVGIFTQSTPVAAATNNSINFQARLLGRAGNVAPDGNYNVEFKIYNAQSSSGSSQGACAGDAACLWTETRTSANRVRVANGYMSVTLGSVTAFPGNMDWSQDLWLTMNIGGAGVSASWDGEMNPRLHLTAVPYAMSAATAVRAGTADILQNNGVNASTLGWASQTSTRSILLPDASGTVCLAGTEGCGFALNGGNTTGSAFTIGTNDNYGLNLEVNNTTVASFTNTGAALFKNSTNSTAGFDIQNAGSESMLKVNTQDNIIGLGTGTTSIIINNSGQNGSWTTSSNPLPKDLNSLNSVTANGYIYVLGGYATSGGSQSLVYYARVNADGSTGTWTTSSNPLPAARQSATTIVSNGYIYVLGGQQGAGNPRSTVYYAKLNADGSTGTWTTSSNPLPQNRVNHGSVAYNGYIYVFGGSDGVSTNYNSAYYAKVNSDGSTSAWAAATNTPNTTATTRVVVANGYVYVTSDSSSTVHYARLNSDGTIGTWTAANSLPAARGSTTMVYAGGYLYLVAGNDSNTVYYAKLNADGSTGTWTTSSNPLPTAHEGGAAVVLNGYIYELGGWSWGTNTNYDTVYYSRLATTNINTNAVFAGGVAGAQAQNDNEFTTLGQVRSIISGALGGSALLQGGNSFGTAMVLGTNDNYGINFKTNGNTTASISSTGAMLLRNTTNSSSAFVVRNAASTVDVLVVDTATPGVTVNGSFTVNSLTGETQVIRPGVDSLADPQFKVQSSLGNNAFTVGTSATLTQVGIGLGSNNVPAMAGNGLEVRGSIRISGSGASNVDTFTTPMGSSLSTRINVGLYDPGAYNQIIAMGLPAGASATSRAITMVDARAGVHQPTIAVLSPNESQIMGFSWDGSNTRGFLTSTTELGVKVGGVERGVFGSGGLDVTGNVAATGGVMAGGVSTLNETTRIRKNNGSALLIQDATGSYTMADFNTDTGLAINSNATFKNFTDSSSAFNIKKANGSNILSVNSLTSNVVIDGTLEVNGGLTIGGSTVNRTLALNDFSSGGSIGPAASTVDIYTSISVNQSTSDQTLTIPVPTGSTNYGRMLLISNIGSANFTLLGSLLKTGASAWLVWSNTSGGASWQYAGADGSSILNQNSSAQVANFSINGTGTASTLTAGSFTSSSNLILQAASGNNVTISPGAAAGGSGTLNLAVNAATLNIGNGSNNARTINIGNTAGSQTQTITIGNNASSLSTTTVQGSAGILMLTNASSSGVIVRSATNSTTAFDIQNASNQSLFKVDTSASSITIGYGTAVSFRIGSSTNNTTYDSSTGASSLAGAARRARTIMLQPEYTGAILDASSDATCASANSGTLVSGVDLANRTNFYNWSSTSGSAQCYNVVVQVPIPTDFSAWASATPLKVQTRTTNTTNGTANIELRDSAGSVIYNYVSVTPGSTNAWTQTTVASAINGSYTGGDFLTLRIRVSSNSSANIQLGAITMDYLSRW